MLLRYKGVLVLGNQLLPQQTIETRLTNRHNDGKWMHGKCNLWFAEHPTDICKTLPPEAKFRWSAPQSAHQFAPYLSHCQLITFSCLCSFLRWSLKWSNQSEWWWLFGSENCLFTSGFMTWRVSYKRSGQDVTRTGDCL